MIRDDEMKGAGNVLGTHFRQNDTRLGRWWGRDPKAASFPWSSSYVSMGNNPISRIDPFGNADYYANSGEHLGNDNENDNKVFISDIKTINSFTDEDNEIDWTKVQSNSIELDIGHDVFLGLASAIHAETGVAGSVDEALAIGNVIINISNQGAGKLKSLEDLVMFDNSVIQGATQTKYSNFLRLSKEKQNSKGALKSAINAVGYNQGLFGNDYSAGADGWDGKDLLDIGWRNDHRKYIWTEASLHILRKYSQMYSNGVNVQGFKYTNVNAQASALKVIGETIFYDILTPLGGYKQGTKEIFKYQE